MCSCIRSIVCCWNEQVRSKQQEVAENERISPHPGYINAAFDEPITTVVLHQPQHCDVTIEAPPRLTITPATPLHSSHSPLPEVKIDHSESQQSSSCPVPHTSLDELPENPPWEKNKDQPQVELNQLIEKHLAEESPSYSEEQDPLVSEHLRCRDQAELYQSHPAGEAIEILRENNDVFDSQPDMCQNPSNENAEYPTTMCQEQREDSSLLSECLDELQLSSVFQQPEVLSQAQLCSSQETYHSLQVATAGPSNAIELPLMLYSASAGSNNEQSNRSIDHETADILLSEMSGILLAEDKSHSNTCLSDNSESETLGSKAELYTSKDLEEGFMSDDDVTNQNVSESEDCENSYPLHGADSLPDLAEDSKLSFSGNICCSTDSGLDVSIVQDSVAFEYQDSINKNNLKHATDPWSNDDCDASTSQITRSLDLANSTFLSALATDVSSEDEDSNQSFNFLPSNIGISILHSSLRRNDSVGDKSEILYTYDSDCDSLEENNKSHHRLSVDSTVTDITDAEVSYYSDLRTPETFNVSNSGEYTVDTYKDPNRLKTDEFNNSTDAQPISEERLSTNISEVAADSTAGLEYTYDSDSFCSYHSMEDKTNLSPCSENTQNEDDELQNEDPSEIIDYFCTGNGPADLKQLAVDKVVKMIDTALQTQNNLIKNEANETGVGIYTKIKLRDLMCNAVKNYGKTLDYRKMLSTIGFNYNVESKETKMSSQNSDSMDYTDGNTFVQRDEETENQAMLDTLVRALQSGNKTNIESSLHEVIKYNHNLISATITGGYNPATLAAYYGYTYVFEIMKEANVEFNYKDKNGCYPMHYAILENCKDIFLFLLQENKWQQLTDRQETALHLAVLEGDKEMCRQLIQAAIESDMSLDTLNQGGMTPLHLAITRGQADIVRCLLQKGCNVNASTADGISAVLLAAHSQQLEIVEILLSFGASALAEDSNGDNMLHLFVSCRSYLILDVMIAHYFPHEALDLQNRLGQSPLHIAAKMGDDLAILSLVNAGANINLADNDGCTPLLLAATESRSNLIMTLVTLGADVHQQDNTGNNVLHYVARTGSGPITDFLQHQCNVSPSAKNHRGQTPVHLAAQCAHSDVIAFMLTAKCDVNVQDNDGRVPLHEACYQGDLTTVAQLVYAGAKVNIRDRYGFTPLVGAGLRRVVDVLHYLISRDTDSASLYELASHALPDDIMFLKGHNVDFDKQDQQGYTALHHSIHNHNEHVAKVLLDAGVTASLMDHQGNSVLHLACASSSVELIDLLIKSQCLIDSTNEMGETPLFIAAMESRHHVVKLLLRHGANMNVKLRDGRTLVFIAVERNDADLTTTLMSYGADVNYVCSGNMTRPIHVAARLGHKNVMDVLLQTVNDIDIVEFFSRKTPLHLAAEGGWRDVVLQLLAAGADVNLETGCAKKPLHLAASEGHAEVVELLLRAGTQLSLLDEDGCPRYDLSRHRYVWAIIKAWALQHPSAVLSHRRIPAALASLRSAIREAFRVSRGQNTPPEPQLTSPPPYRY